MQQDEPRPRFANEIIQLLKAKWLFQEAVMSIGHTGHGTQDAIECEGSSL